MEKNKIIYIVSLNGIKNAGGVERVTFYLNEILKTKYQVKVLSKSKINYGKLNNLLHPLFLSLKLFFIPNKIVIGNSWHCFLYPADYSIHHGTSAGIIKNTAEGGISEKITAKLEKISANKAKKIIAVSENCKNELIEFYGISENKIIVLNNFVDDETFIPNIKNQNEKIKILFSGALCNKKGLQKLLDFSNFLETIPENIELNIASNYKNYVSLFENNKKTKILSNISFDKMKDFYNSGDILFFPTLYEGFSMSVLEALSCGLPVVGTKFAVTPELYKYNFCKLIDYNEENENILKTILTLYELNYSRKEEIHKIISKDFGKKQYIEKLLTIIKG